MTSASVQASSGRQTWQSNTSLHSRSPIFARAVLSAARMPTALTTSPTWSCSARMYFARGFTLRFSVQNRRRREGNIPFFRTRSRIPPG